MDGQVVRCQVVPCPAGWVKPTLRPYQEQALAAWRAFGQRGVASAQAGTSRMRLAVAALAGASGASLVLCPTKAHATDWARTLARWYAGPVGLVADGDTRIEAVTVATFEGAQRHVAAIAHPSATLVVDEAHQCCEPAHRDLLQTLPRAATLGLTTPACLGRATVSDRLEALVGPVVCEVLATNFLAASGAKLETVCLRVALDAEERAAYERSYHPFASLHKTFVRAHQGATGSAFVRSLAQSAAGRRALEGCRLAARIAAFPRAKQAVVAALLDRHRSDRTIVFTAFDEDASALAASTRLTVITSGKSGRERHHSNLPDANIAILTAGSFGASEWLQRIGQVLRPHAGQEPLAYELVTARTLDDRRARSRARRPNPSMPSSSS